MRPQPRVQRRRPPKWMAYPPRHQPDSAWTDVAVVAWSILAILVVYVLASWMPHP